MRRKASHASRKRISLHPGAHRGGRVPSLFLHRRIRFFRHTRRSGWGWSPIGAFAISRLDSCGEPTRFTCSSWSSYYRWSSWGSATRASAGRSGASWNAGITWHRDMRKSEILFPVSFWVSELNVEYIFSSYYLRSNIYKFFIRNSIALVFAFYANCIEIVRFA